MMLGSLLIGVFVIIILDGLESIAYFIIGGHLPLTNITLPPMFMLTFWVLIVPSIYLFRKTLGNLFWHGVGAIGTVNQRRINRRIRLPRRSATIEPLVIVTLLAITSELPKKSTRLPELSLRRRFLALSS